MSKALCQVFLGKAFGSGQIVPPNMGSPSNSQVFLDFGIADKGLWICMETLRTFTDFVGEEKSFSLYPYRFLAEVP